MQCTKTLNDIYKVIPNSLPSLDLDILIFTLITLIEIISTYYFETLLPNTMLNASVHFLFNSNNTPKDGLHVFHFTDEEIGYLKS